MGRVSDATGSAATVGMSGIVLVHGRVRLLGFSSWKRRPLER